MRPANLHARHRLAQQRGAVLVIALLLLLVLTIIGITVMQMSRLQERMAGNSRDVNLSFQAAEGSMRAAESFIRQQNNRPVACSVSPCTVWIEGSVIGTTANQDPAWWLSNGNTFGMAAMGDLQEAPQAVIEELGFVRTDGGVVMGQEPPDGRDFYQVTSRSTGGSGQAETVLQSTYTRRF
jgi:type IV pilus assembly protein PilX